MQGPLRDRRAAGQEKGPFGGPRAFRHEAAQRAKGAAKEGLPFSRIIHPI